MQHQPVLPRRARQKLKPLQGPGRSPQRRQISVRSLEAAGQLDVERLQRRPRLARRCRCRAATGLEHLHPQAVLQGGAVQHQPIGPPLPCVGRSGQASRLRPHAVEPGARHIEATEHSSACAGQLSGAQGLTLRLVLQGWAEQGHGQTHPGGQRTGQGQGSRRSGPRRHRGQRTPPGRPSQRGHLHGWVPPAAAFSTRPKRATKRSRSGGSTAARALRPGGAISINSGRSQARDRWCTTSSQACMRCGAI